MWIIPKTTYRYVPDTGDSISDLENLVAKIEERWLDPAPIYTDLKTFPFSRFRGLVDILSGGFPCQPFSQAGAKKGVEDPRHLWPYIEQGIRDLGRPSCVFFENVEGIISTKIGEQSVLQHVLTRLEQLGYRATAGIFSASEIGASHQRKRVFILGINDTSGFRVRDFECSIGHPAKRGEYQRWYEPPRTIKSEVGGASNGDPDRMDISELYVSCSSRPDEIRMLGNGVVPDTASRAFTELCKELVNTEVDGVSRNDRHRF